MHASGRADLERGGAEEAGRVLLGRFRVERVLGRGGMGEVLLAHDTLLQRQVALKHLRADGPQAANRRNALLKEARRVSQVSDHRIAAIYDVLDLGDDVLLVMEYVDGVTLRERLREPVPLELFWHLSSQCLGALGAAHAKGVIHRDIKPENLMLTRGQEIKVLDFGIALRSEQHSGDVNTEDSTSTIERYRRPAGTLHYMAPEAHSGGHIDERTDIFSLGAVFYEMLAGRQPFAGGGHESVVDHILFGAPAQVSAVNPSVPPALSRVVERMLARDPAQRHACCAEVEKALEDARATISSGSEPGATSTTASRIRARTPAVRLATRVVTALAVLAVAVAAALAWRALAAPRLPAARNVAVLLPETPGAQPNFAAFALGSVVLLSGRLQRHQDDPRFQIAPFNEVFTEKARRPEDARKLLGADLALVPILEQTRNMLRGRLELREPSRGRLIRATVFEVPTAETMAFADSLYRRAVALLGLPSHSPGSDPRLRLRGPGTMLFLAQGIGRTLAAESPDDLGLAREELETACRAEPGAALPHVWLSTAELRSHAMLKDTAWLARADASAREAVAHDDQLADAHRALGEVLAARKQHARSLAEYRRACALDPTQDESWLLYGRAYRLLGDVAGERAVFAAAVERRPHAFRPRWMLASLEFRHGRLEVAKRTYREAIQLAPGFSKAYSGLGAILVWQGEYARAIDTLRHSASLRPSAVAFTNLGTAYFNTGRLAESVDAYNQALQYGMGDNDYLLWLNLGDAYFWLRDQPEQAREAYAQAVRLGREVIRRRIERGSTLDAEIAVDLAGAFPKLSRPDSARAYLGLALRSDSTNFKVQYGAALTLWQLGDRARALDWLERAAAGGYPAIWMRDSPVHREWRTEPRFMALLAPVSTAAHTTTPPGGGGRR